MTSLKIGGGFERSGIGLRWWVDGQDLVHAGWPPVGEEVSAKALGWLSEDGTVGVVEHCAFGEKAAVTEALDAAFPGRTWTRGDWTRSAA